MKRSVLLWILAVILSISTAIYQRKTGPTWPVTETIDFSGQKRSIVLDRTHAGPGDQEVTVILGDSLVTGELIWRRYPTRDTFTTTPMNNEDGTLTGHLPHQPPAGKLEYRIRLQRGQEEAYLPAEGSVVTRFRGDVPIFIIIPHILFIFLAMAYSNRAGLEALSRGNNLRKQTYVTISLLFIGGMIFGPLMQKYAFGALWTGFPFGHDLTDNKTLVALIGWLVAFFKVRKNPKAWGWVLGAATLTLVVYLIPHSLLGSELKYE